MMITPPINVRPLSTVKNSLWADSLRNVAHNSEITTVETTSPNSSDVSATTPTSVELVGLGAVHKPFIEIPIQASAAEVDHYCPE